MSTRRAAFTQTDVKRAVRAAESLGKKVAGIDFLPQGGFRILLGEPAVLTSPGASGPSDWDVVLPQ